MYASRANNLNLLEVLVDLKADLDSKDDNEWTVNSYE